MNIEQKSNRNITTLCLLLGNSRQAFYQQKRGLEQGVMESELVIQQVMLIRKSQRMVGTRKLHHMLEPFLLQHKIDMGRDALFTLLLKHNLLIRKRKSKVPRTTFSDHWFKKYANLIIGMSIVSPNTLWVSDITYITLTGAFAYLSLITDAYSRMIVGYHLSKHLRAEGCVKALKMGIKQLSDGSKLIHHSDRGCQYCSTEYVDVLQENNISISMTQNSDPRENAIAERVNGIIKQEFLAVSYPNFAQALEEVKNGVNVYNNERVHSSIDMLTPFQAHNMTGELKKHWKNYYLKKEKEVIMT